jgi:hypothetical protein
VRTRATNGEWQSPEGATGIATLLPECYQTLRRNGDEFIGVSSEIGTESNRPAKSFSVDEIPLKCVECEQDFNRLIFLQFQIINSDNGAMLA